MMKRSLVAAAFASALCLVNDVRAADDDSRADGGGWSPVGIGLCAPIQFPFAADDVYGFRFGGFHGRHANVYGLDVGLIESQESFAGLQVAAVSWAYGEVAGLQVACASVDSTFAGLQAAALNWNRADSAGVQFAVANADQSGFTGWAAAALNVSQNFTGFQLGAINLADEMSGLQVGVVNAAQRLDGLQVGVLNLVCESKLPIMVVVNAGF